MLARVSRVAKQPLNLAFCLSKARCKLPAVTCVSEGGFRNRIISVEIALHYKNPSQKEKEKEKKKKRKKKERKKERKKRRRRDMVGRVRTVTI